MKTANKILITLAILIVAITFISAKRNQKEVTKYRKLSGCTQIVDHIIPLCAGGSDTADNMQCQDKTTSYRKDIFERALCKEMKKQHVKLIKEQVNGR